MIDTGSTKSFLSPRIVERHFSNLKIPETFEVISTHACSKHDGVVIIDLFKIFNTDIKHKFYIFDVGDSYDGLIGSDLLFELKSIINMEKSILVTENAVIPIYFQPGINNFTPVVIELSPRSEQKVKVPTDLYSGQGILEYQEFTPSVRMPSALVTCNKSYAYTIVQNASSEPMTLTITAPFKVTKYNGESNIEPLKINYLEINDSERENMLQNNLEKLRLNHMNEEERDKIYSLCLEYKDIFYCEGIPLTFTNDVKHIIRTKHDDPIYVKPYRQSHFQKEEIKRQVDKLLQENIIQNSHSPWNAPVHLVPKKIDVSGEQKYRLVVDYRKLNEITCDDRYPLPNITDIFDKLGDSMYFSTLDLASGYHQIEVLEPEKTAFSTNEGHFEFLRMPFGLKTAPATFQRAMDNILRGLQGTHCLVYLDDIIVFSKTLDQHINKLKTIFDTLRKANLKVQLDKSEFLKKEVLYLGHTITPEGLKPNEDKIDAILKYPLPKTTTEIKSFLGLIGYYRKFIKDFAKITKPMTNCLKKNVKIELNDEYIKSFETCKALLTNAPLLQYPNFDKPFILTTDASNYAIGAVLSQGTIGNDKPVAYASRTLNGTETKYSTVEKELLAILWAVKYFRPYLYGRKFQIYTDHRPLTWLYSLTEPNSKLTRWRLRLQEYDFEVVYRSGKQNSNADALSRIKVNLFPTLFSGVKNIIKNISQEEAPGPSTTSNNKDNLDSNKATVDSSETQSVVDSEETMTASEVPDIQEIIQLSDDEDCLITETSSPRAIPITHNAIDTKPIQIIVINWYKNEIQVTNRSREKQKILEVRLPPNNEELVKQFLKYNLDEGKTNYIYFDNKDQREIFNIVASQLFKSNPIKLIECTERVIYVEDEEEQESIVNAYHEGKSCHRGIKETLSRMKRNYYWPNMEQIVTAVINKCDTCKKMKYDRHPIQPMLQLTQTQSRPFEEIFIDLFSIEGKLYLTLVDAFSKLGQAILIENRSTPEVVRALITYFSFYGTPNKISCDPGSEFNNALMKETLDFYKIILHIGTPNNPNSMGIVERFHSTIIEIYRLAKHEQNNLDACSLMTYAITTYNNTIHSVTNLTPFEVVFGHTNSNSTFNVEFEKSYMQQLIKEHAKKTSYLYKYLEDKMHNIKVNRQKEGENIPLNIGDKIFTKLVNQRRGKDKPRYEEAEVIGPPIGNVIPVKIRDRITKVPLKNVRRPNKE